MNVPLLRKIQNIIRQSPEEFDMGSWHWERGYEASCIRNIGDLCGTTHCIAGWAQVLSPEPPPSEDQY